MMGNKNRTYPIVTRPCLVPYYKVIIAFRIINECTSTLQEKCAGWVIPKKMIFSPHLPIPPSPHPPIKINVVEYKSASRELIKNV